MYNQTVIKEWLVIHFVIILLTIGGHGLQRNPIQPWGLQFMDSYKQNTKNKNKRQKLYQFISFLNSKFYKKKIYVYCEQVALP